MGKKERIGKERLKNRKEVIERGVHTLIVK